MVVIEDNERLEINFEIIIIDKLDAGGRVISEISPDSTFKTKIAF